MFRRFETLETSRMCEMFGVFCTFTRREMLDESNTLDKLAESSTRARVRMSDTFVELKSLLTLTGDEVFVTSVTCSSELPTGDSLRIWETSTELFRFEIVHETDGTICVIMSTDTVRVTRSGVVATAVVAIVGSSVATTGVTGTAAWLLGTTGVTTSEGDETAVGRATFGRVAALARAAEAIPRRVNPPTSPAHMAAFLIIE